MRRARWAWGFEDARVESAAGAAKVLDARDALYLCYLSAALIFVWWCALRGPGVELADEFGGEFAR